MRLSIFPEKEPFSMKKILVSLLAILLLLSMVCVMATSCKDKNSHKGPTPDEPDGPRIIVFKLLLGYKTAALI